MVIERDVAVERDVEVPMRDGALLSANVYRPAAARLPAVRGPRGLVEPKPPRLAQHRQDDVRRPETVVVERVLGHAGGRESY